MFRRQPEPHVLIELARHQEQPDLRDDPDPDPVVEAATERLRQQLSSLQPVDAWGRPVAWRQVARIALGDLVDSARVRDALTVDALLQVVDLDEEPAVPAQEPPQWREFFDAVKERDRLLRDQAGSSPSE